MKTIVLGVAVMAAGVFTSCGEKGWSEEDEKEFMKGCTKSYINEINTAMDEADMGELVDQDELAKVAERSCSCLLEKAMEKYDSVEEANKDKDAVDDIDPECEATEEEIDAMISGGE